MPDGGPCTRIKVGIAGKTLRITDASKGKPAQGVGSSFVFVKAKRDMLSPISVKILGGPGDDSLGVWTCQHNGVNDPPPPYFSTVELVGGPGNHYLHGGLGADEVVADASDALVAKQCESLHE
ncbi:MAG TPA: hypothetical protein VIS07_04350 [Candidatus Binatia bacterium]